MVSGNVGFHIFNAPAKVSLRITIHCLRALGLGPFLPVRLTTVPVVVECVISLFFLCYLTMLDCCVSGVSITLN